MDRAYFIDLYTYTLQNSENSFESLLIIKENFCPILLQTVIASHGWISPNFIFGVDLLNSGVVSVCMQEVSNAEAYPTFDSLRHDRPIPLLADLRSRTTPLALRLMMAQPRPKRSYPSV